MEVKMELKEIREGLLKLEKPQLLIVDEINGDQYVHVAKALAYLTSRGSPDLKIIIDSSGGSVTAGLDIYDAIRLYEGQTEGVVISKAHSMATIILQACQKRSCAQHAGLLIHYVAQGNINLGQLQDGKRCKNIIDGLVRDQERIYKILVLKTGKSVAQIKKVCAEDREMYADEAKKFGLVDCIV